MLKMLRDVKCVKQASCKFDLSNKSEKRHKQGKGEITIVLSKTADITHLTRLDYRHMCDIRSRMDSLSEC